MKDFNRINLSVCYWLLNEKEKALKYLNKIKITRLTLPIIKFNLAKTYEEIENFEKAKELYKEVAEKGNKLYMGKIAQEKILELS